MTATAIDPGTTTTSGAIDAAAAAAAAGAPGAAAAGDKPFYEGWSPELLASPSITNAKSPEEIAKMAVSLEKRLGAPANRLLTLPEKPDDAEGYGKIYDALGRPANAAGYKLELPADAPQDLKDRGGRFAEEAHKLGLNQAQVQGLMAFNAAEGGALETASKEAGEAAAAAAVTALKKEWGADYDTRSKEIGRFLTDAGGDKLFQELAVSGAGNNVELLKALGKLVSARAEPGAIDTSGGAQLRDGRMTPAGATAAIGVFEANAEKMKALREKSHPQHAAALTEWKRLARMADGQDPDA